VSAGSQRHSAGLGTNPFSATATARGRQQLLDAIYAGQPFQTVLRDLGLTPNQVRGSPRPTRDGARSSRLPSQSSSFAETHGFTGGSGVSRFSEGSIRPDSQGFRRRSAADARMIPIRNQLSHDLGGDPAVGCADLWRLARP
jgi:hypothetical protein